MMPLAAPVAAEEDARAGLSIAQITAIVWAYRKVSAIIAIGIVLLAVGVIKMLPKTYSATSQLLLNYEVNDPLSGNIFPTGLLASYMATQIQIMQSPEFLGSVVDELKLQSNKEFAAGYNGKSSLRDYTKAALLGHLQIVQGNSGSQLMYITASSGNPVTAAQIANSVATLYTTQQVKRLNDPASVRAQRYEQELADLKQKFDAAQDKVAAYRQRTGITELGISDNDAESQNLNAIESRLVEAQANRRQLEIKQSSNQALSPTVMSSNTVLLLKNQIATLETQLAQARTTYGEQHPRIIELKTQIDAAKTELNKAVGNFSDSTSAELEAARALEAKLTAARNDQKAKVLQVRQNMDEGKKLLLELESARQSYKTMLDSYDKVQSSATSGYNNVSVASKAEVPVEATKPKKMKLLAMAVLAALGLAVGLPLAYELAMNRRIRVRDDMEKDMGLPVLAEFHAAAVSGVSR
ncbi:MAG: GNVR domain-containing protein [Steroidobacteraceae bacterium]